MINHRCKFDRLDRHQRNARAVYALHKRHTQEGVTELASRIELRDLARPLRNVHAREIFACMPLMLCVSFRES